MPIKAKDVLSRARTILQDAGSTRWLLSELCDWLDDALREVSFYKPTALSDTIVMPLAAGTYQELPEGQQLLRAHRNITSDVGVMPRISGPAVTPIVREILDAQLPDWHDTTFMPFSATARHVISDTMNPRSFYVFPGNNGTGKIEITVSLQPEPLARPNDINDIGGYTADIPINPIYMGPLVDFVLYRAFSKDMQFAGAGERAVAHYTNFQNALNLRQQIEAMGNLNTSQTQPNS